TRVFKVQHGDPDELANEILGLLALYGVTPTGEGEGGVYIVPLTRLNSLVAVAFDRIMFDEIEHWLRLLDIPPEEGAGRQTFVYNGENAKAEDLAGVLNELCGGGGGAGAPGAPGAPGAGAGVRGITIPGKTGAPGVPGAPGQPQGPQPIFKEEVRIVADPVTNSLVVLATKRDYQLIADVLKKIDVVPRQVLLEVTIAEITLNKDLSFGVEWALAQGKLNQTIAQDTSGTSLFRTGPQGL